MIGPLYRYPPGPITPAGRCHLLKGDLPQMSYTSGDGTIVFNLVGPLAIFDRTQPERIQVNALKGLMPPWQNIEQKGATQDGSTYVTSLYDPMDVELTVTAYGRDPIYRRQVMRHWIDSWDPKAPGELAWQTGELGRWWAPVRWAKTPVEPLLGPYRRQRFTMVAKAYDAFWRSYDSTDAYGIGFNTVDDPFTTASASGVPGWTIAYTGTGSGVLFCTGYSVSSTLAGNQGAVARLNSYTSATDNQVITVTFGNMPADWMHYGFNDIWFRMANTGTPGTDGLRVRIGNYHVTLSAFVGGTETVLRDVFNPKLQPLQPGDQICVTAGISGNARSYTVQYMGNVGLLGFTNGKTSPRQAVLTLMSVVESGTTSELGAGYRSVGFGMQAQAGDITSDYLPNQPADVLDFAAGDNTTSGIPQNGFLTRYNVGDQPMWDRFTLIGPGTFTLGNGPNSTESVVFGPLLAGQVVQIRTNPRLRSVVDLTAALADPAATTAVWNGLGFHPFGGAVAQALADLKTLWSDFSAPADPPVTSVFGVVEPQGNLYSLLQGRFSNPIPPKPAASPAPEYHVAVSITDGDAGSGILVAGTPLRRYPQ